MAYTQRIRVLVSGYGVITSGLIGHLHRTRDQLPYFEVSLLSRHLNDPPNPDVELVQEDGLADTVPDLILGCFESDARSRAFWTSKEMRSLITTHRPACVEMSTLSRTWVSEWHSYLAGLGANAVECPVTGSRVGAASGELSAFYFSAEADEVVDHFLGRCTSTVYRFSEQGRPTAFKLLYNVWGAACLHAMGVMAAAMARELGVDFALARQIVSTDGWMARVCQSKLGRMQTRDFGTADFAVRHMIKDLELSKDLVPGSLYDLVLADYRRASAAFGPGADFSAISALWSE